MTKCFISKNEIEIKGHACYADAGKDIVCAGVSVIICTLAEFLAKNGFDIEYRFDNGEAYVKCRDTDERVNTAFEMAKTGLLKMEEHYPGFVRCEENNPSVSTEEMLHLIHPGRSPFPSVQRGRRRKESRI